MDGTAMQESLPVFPTIFVLGNTGNRSNSERRTFLMSRTEPVTRQMRSHHSAIQRQLSCPNGYSGVFYIGGLTWYVVTLLSSKR